MNLKGKSAIVSGGGRDIGRACVMRLAAAGADVAINYHSSSKGADSAVKEITAAGGKAFAMQGDMTKASDVQALVDRTVKEFGKVDIVMPITGGIVARKTVSDMDMDHWQQVMDLNVTSAVLLIKASLPHMAQGGAIVTMASQAARDGGGPGAIAYAAAKGAVLTMTRGLAKELAPKIRVNSMCPGMIDTDFHKIFTKPEVRAHVANVTPLKREGASMDVANLAVYLPEDGVPLWDYDLPGDRPQYRDTSAGAVTAAGLYALAQGFRRGELAVKYTALADRILKGLVENYDIASVKTSQGLLKEGAAFVDLGRANNMLPYGDYYYVEALMRSLGHNNFFW